MVKNPSIFLLPACALLALSALCAPVHSSASERGELERYTVKFQGESLAAALGPMTRDSTHRRTAEGRAILDVRSSASLQFLDNLRNEQDRRVAAMEAELGRRLEVLQRFDAVLNGVEIELTAAEASLVEALPFVEFVAEPIEEFPLTFGSVGWVGADAVWDGSATLSGVGNHGEGLIAGIIDTGMNFSNHSSFAPVDAFGVAIVNPLGEDVFVGGCDPSHPQFDPALVCNSKLIGSLVFDGAGHNDTNGHGSHVGGTVAGNFVEGPVNTSQGAQPVPFVSGVAPRASTISFKACAATSCGGTAASLQAALNQGVASANYSIGPPSGRGSNPWTNTQNRIMLDMVAAGIFVAAAAGNTGPSVSTPTAHVVNKGPWLMTVANSTHGGLISNPVSAIEPGPVPGDLQDIPAREGSGPALTSDLEAAVVFAGEVDAVNVEGCNAWTGSPFTGAIALIRRGTCNFSQKVNHAVTAGAIGVIVYNNQGDSSIVMGALEGTAVPSVMIGQSLGEALGAFAADNPANLTRIQAEKIVQFDPGSGNILSAGSLTGPNLDFDVTQPDIAAPGSSILAPVSGSGAPFAFLSGTSMASPHVAGAGLLMMNEHPDWTVTEIKSALLLTADGIGRKPNGTTPWDADDVGSGMMDLTRAARSGLVMPETFAGFLAQNPATGGDPRLVNHPSMRHTSCDPGCDWTRTVRNTLNAPTSWQATASGDGYEVSVSPAEFDLLPGDVILSSKFEDTGAPVSSFQTIAVTVSNNTAGNQMRFGELILTETGDQAPDARMTIAVSQVLPPTPPF